MDVQITEESRRFVASQVTSGRYASEDEVIEDALRRMREQEQACQPVKGLESDPLWGLFRDEPGLIDQVVRDAMKDRQSIALRATADE